METKTEEKKENLADFEWDDIDFFGQKTEEPKKPEEKTEEKKPEEEIPSFENFGETPKKKEPKKEPKKEEEPKKEKKEEPKKEEPKKEDEPDFFVDPNENKSSDDDEKFFNVLAQGMKDKGVLTSVDIPEDADLTEDGFVELYETEIDNRITETFEGFFEELDNDAKAFLKHKKDGGSTQSFFNVLKDSSAIPTGNLEEIPVQKLIAKHYLKTVEELDPEDVDDKITWLEETGKLEKYAEKYDKKLKTIASKQEKLLEKQRKDNLKIQADNAKAFVTDIKTTLKNTDNIMKFPITKIDKKELIDYITKPEVKVGKNKFVTGLQDGLKNIMKDNKKLILLAKLIKSDFDVSNLEVKAETKKTIEMKDKLNRAKRNNKASTSKQGSRKNLSDFF